MAKKVKAKTKRAAAKRFKVTGTGKIKMKHAFRSHMSHNKTTKQKRHSKKAGIMNNANAKNIIKTLHN